MAKPAAEAGPPVDIERGALGAQPRRCRPLRGRARLGRPADRRRGRLSASREQGNPQRGQSTILACFWDGSGELIAIVTSSRHKRYAITPQPHRRSQFSDKELRDSHARVSGGAPTIQIRRFAPESLLMLAHLTKHVTRTTRTTQFPPIGSVLRNNGNEWRRVWMKRPPAASYRRQAGRFYPSTGALPDREPVAVRRRSRVSEPCRSWNPR